MDIDSTAAMVQELVDNNADRNDLYDRVDDAVNCIFEPSAALKELPFIQNRHYALTDIADARNAGVRTFAILLPDISVQPNSDNEYEYERVERIEEALKWEFTKMNRVTLDTIHSQIIESAINYHAVALQTQYLPYHYKDRKKEPKVKALLRQRNFNWILHHPGTVHAFYNSDGSLEGVAKVASYTAQDLESIYGKNNEGIRKIRAQVEQDKATMMQTEMVLVDWTDWERRQVWAGHGNDVSTVPDTRYVIMDEEHDLPFIPWVVVDKRNPLWQSVLESGMWDNIQHMNVIRFAKAIEQASAPSLLIQTADGSLKGVYIDPTNPSNPMQIPAGASVQPLPRPQIDPQLEQHYVEMRQSIQRSTVSQVLTDIGQYSDAPFSTVNQIVQMALGQLAPAKQAAEDAESRALYQMFEWIEHSGIPLISYREKTKEGQTDDMKTKKRGEQIGIFPGPAQEPPEDATDAELDNYRKRIYFDLDALYVDVKMRSQNTADEQARQNVVINAITHMGASQEWGWEQMGYTNFKLIQEQRASEELERAEIQKVVAMKQLEVQAAQMEMQMQAQQAQAQQQAEMQQQQQPQNSLMDMNAENAMSTLQGTDMRSGGNPAAMTAPSMTREAINGEQA